MKAKEELMVSLNDFSIEFYKEYKESIFFGIKTKEIVEQNTTIKHGKLYLNKDGKQLDVFVSRYERGTVPSDLDGMDLDTYEWDKVYGMLTEMITKYNITDDPQKLVELSDFSSQE